MTLQEAVEAPRVWTEGNALEVEPPCRKACAQNSPRWATRSGVATVAGGMNGIASNEDGTLRARLLRADGTPVGMAGGLARAGVRFVRR